jgi:hypothetical protein
MRFLCGWLVREINQEKSVAFRNCYRMLCIEWGGANRPGMMGIPEASPGTARKSDR